MAIKKLLELNIENLDEAVSATYDGPFDKAKKHLEEDSFRIISLRENALLRILEGPASPVSQNGNFTKEAVLYFPRRGNYLVKNSPILEFPQQATQAHRKGEEFYITEEQSEEYLQNSVKFPKESLYDDISISLDELGDKELTVFAFGGEKNAKEYGKFLRYIGAKDWITVWTISKEFFDKKEKSFARQLWFGPINSHSRLDGARSYLDEKDIVKTGEYANYHPTKNPKGYYYNHCKYGPVRGIKNLNLS